MEQIDFETFVGSITEAVRTALGDGHTVRHRVVHKNNGLELTGLVISAVGENIAPTVYMEEYYEQYRAGCPLSKIAREIADVYENNRIDQAVDMGFFLDYSLVRDRIFVRVVNYEENVSRLDSVPYERILDLAQICYYAYDDPRVGCGSIQVEVSHLDRWGISEEQLFRDARNNTLEKLGVEILGMDEVLRELAGKCVSEEPAVETNDYVLEMDDIMSGLLSLLPGPMYIMSLRGRRYGAACLCFPQMMDEFASKIGESFYVLPSSIHELVLVPEAGNQRGNMQVPTGLHRLVREVNECQVSVTDRLSDNVYYYDMNRRNLFLT